MYYKEEPEMSNKNAVPGTDGNLYVPYEKRTGEKSVVYFTRDLRAGLPSSSTQVRRRDLISYRALGLKSYIMISCRMLR